MFRNNLRRRRQELGISETRLACKIKISVSTLSDLELGKRQPWPKVRRDLAETLGVPESELFPDCIN